jgi:hypothetical protein
MKKLISSTTIAFLVLFSMAAFSKDFTGDIYFYAAPGWMITAVNNKWGYNEQLNSSSVRLYAALSTVLPVSAKITLKKSNKKITIATGRGSWSATLFGNAPAKLGITFISHEMSCWNATPAYIQMCVNGICATETPTKLIKK